MTLSSDLSFGTHIEKICKKASRMLGLIRRSCREFSPDTLRHLYISLVRPVLEYASVVWSPSYVTKIDRLERVQRQFLRAWCYKKKVQFTKAEYRAICQQAGVMPLSARRDIGDLLFLHKIMHNNINSNYLLQCVCFHVPGRAMREPRVFRPPFARIDVCSHHFFYRSQERYCDIVSRNACLNIDIFKMTFGEFRHKLCRAYTNT